MNCAEMRRLHVGLSKLVTANNRPVEFDLLGIAAQAGAVAVENGATLFKDGSVYDTGFGRAFGDLGQFGREQLNGPSSDRYEVMELLAEAYPRLVAVQVGAMSRCQ